MLIEAIGVAASYAPVYVVPSALTPLPAAVPATCVPCPLQSIGFGSGFGISAEPVPLAL
jgi:hypothetical protein